MPVIAGLLPALGGERHCESKVSCPRAQHNVPGQGSKADKQQALPPTIIPNLLKRGEKRKYTDHKPVDNKIANTENSIDVLEDHLKYRTCPKSLRYTAKPNMK